MYLWKYLYQLFFSWKDGCDVDCSPVCDPYFIFILEDRTFIPILYVALRGRHSCCTCSINVKT
jgi:hypothetical protein